MSDNADALPYPRKRIQRGLVSIVGRILLPILFRFELSGQEHFPTQGPLIVIGNHTAAMEAVFINVYTPWQMEMLSAADIPAEKFVEWLSSFYGVIPLHRGSFDRSALQQALSVLDQNGVVGIFPEGGIWEEGKRKAQTGVAWLSYRSGAPVLPIGFSDTTGKLHAALRLKRPKMEMHVGQVIPPAQLPPDQPRKEFLQSYASRVMAAVHDLVPEEDRVSEPAILNERFDLDVIVHNQSGESVPIPERLRLQHPSALAKLLHKPAILKIFRVNLNMPVEPLEHLHEEPPARTLLAALQPILTYLDEDNPYLLTYRFGPREGRAMQHGLQACFDLLQWVERQGYRIKLIPIRRYYDREKQKEITQIKQGRFEHWM